VHYLWLTECTAHSFWTQVHSNAINQHNTREIVLTTQITTSMYHLSL